MLEHSPQAARRLTLALLTLAALAAEVAAAPEGWPRPLDIGLLAGAVAIAAGMGEILGRRVRRELPRLATLGLTGLLVAPLVVEPMVRQWTSSGRPLELLLIAGLRNLGLGLTALAAWPVALRLAGLVSLFLMLFAVCLGEGRTILWLLGAYGVAGSVWFMVQYWEQLRPIAAPSGTVRFDAPRVRFPWLAVALAALLVLAALPLATVGPRQAFRVLAEWLPSSGGTGESSPYARGGVNDGEEETTGDNPRGTGFVESDKFLDSPLPSLYDLVSELYGEPVRPKEYQRAVALDQDKVAGAAGRKADNQRPGRDFPTARRGPRRPRDPTGRAARALFEVEGRTPLHVRMTVYDHFDGLAWHEAPLDTPARTIVREPQGTWMRLCAVRLPDDVGDPESHRFKITRLEGAVLPAPPCLVRFRVGRVNRPDFFTWARDGVLCVAGRKVPSGVTVETEARVVDPRRMSEVRFLEAADTTRVDRRVATLAAEWGSDHPRGWPQIDAVVAQFRSQYTLDPTANVTDDRTDPLAHFLFTARRGPDYQFATACAVLLRTLGYSTRLATGFYTAPEAFDPDSGHTPVVGDDLHTWPEVRLPDGDWLVIEPTPGYAVLLPRRTWGERLLALLGSMRDWALTHSGLLLAAGAGLALAIWQRQHLLDTCAMFTWQCTGRTSWRRGTLGAFRLLEQRARWAGWPRSASQTPARWMGTFASTSEDRDELAALVRLVERAAYEPEASREEFSEEFRSLCRRVLGLWTYRRFRRLRRQTLTCGVLA